MTLLLLVFFAAAGLMWLSVFGYLFLLAALARRRVPAHIEITDWPHIAVVIPTLNEEQTIGDRLADLERSDYPRDRFDVVVVDGGSRDRTVAHVESAIAAGARLQLWRVPSCGKAHQINYALERLGHELVVVSDADARLDPACIRELIRGLMADPRTAIIGASIRVDTTLPEELLHWRGVNRLWWLEGEACSAAIVSGVCYGARRTAVVAVAHDARAEDVHLSLSAASRGLRVRLSRAAWATETRAPRTMQELLRFRRRRGSQYLRELQRGATTLMPVGARLVHAVRLFHFRLTPLIAAVAAVSGAVLLGTPQWRWVVLVGGAFATPLAVLLYRSHEVVAPGRRWQLPLVAARWLSLLWISLCAIGASGTPRDESVPLEPQGFASADPEEAGS